MRKLNNNKKVYVIDIDGTICKSFNYKTFTDDEYIARKPIKSAVEKLRKLHANGNRIILNTARNWDVHGVTKKWLAIHSIPYDTLVMGKPLGDFYVDDRNMSLKEFDKVKP